MTFSHPVQGHQTRPPCPQADLRGPTGGNAVTPPPVGGKGPPAALRPAARRTQARGPCKSRTPNTSGPSWPQGAQSRSPCCLWVRLLLYSPQNPFPRHQALVMPASLPPSSPEAHLPAPTPARMCVCARVHACSAAHTVSVRTHNGWTWCHSLPLEAPRTTMCLKAERCGGKADAIPARVACWSRRPAVHRQTDGQACGGNRGECQWENCKAFSRHTEEAVPSRGGRELRPEG